MYIIFHLFSYKFDILCKIEYNMNNDVCHNNFIRSDYYMAMKKINVIEAMEMYREEQARKAMELKINETAAAAESDPLWDCWYDMVYMPAAPVVIGDMAELPELDTQIEDFEYDDEPLYVPNAKDLRRMRVSKRRKNAAKHKAKIGRNVTAIWANYAEREHEDMMNWSFKKLKNGERIDVPKSKGLKSDQILKRALKIDAVPEELRKEIIELMESIHRSVNVIAENKAYYERVNRSMEQMTKMEMEVKAA